MRNFPSVLLRFVLGNLNFLTFLVGFGLFSVALAAYSWRLSGVVCGGLLMLIAAYPFLVTRKS